MKKLFNKEIGFLIGVVVYLLIIVFSGGNLSPASKAMPLAVCTLISLMILLKIILTLRVRKKDVADQIGTDTESKAQLSFGERMKNWREDVLLRSIAFIIWMVLIAVFINIFGYLPSIIVFLFALLLIISKASIVKSLAISAGTYVFLYLVFVKMLQVRFPMGIFLK